MKSGSGFTLLLSPAIHSILASEIGKSGEAEKFFSYATRIDLDDYNRDTNQGLHVTSMASAWMNIVYGFGGVRSDKNILSLNPVNVKKWKSYSFKIVYQGNILQITVKDGFVELKLLEKGIISVNIYGKKRKVDNNGIKLKIS